MLKSEHFSYKSSDQKGADYGRQSLRFAYHEYAHAYVYAAEDQQKMSSESFSQKPSDVTADKCAEKKCTTN